MSRIFTRKLRSAPYNLTSSCRFKVFRCCNRASTSVSATNDSSSTVASTSTSSNTNSNGGSSSKNTKLLNVAKVGVFTALTAVIGAASYATYAYTLDEVEQKYKSLCSVSNYSVRDDASSIEKLRAKAYSAVMEVPVKSVEIYLDTRRALEEEIKGYIEPSAEKLLPDLLPQEQHVFTLVLDLNKTLVYSDWKRERGWRTFKRPGADAFLEHLAKFYEIVVFSDEPSAYVDTIVERLDQKGYIRYRLGRPATRYIDGKHCWDLSKLNRDPSHVIFISPRALENCLQPENSIPIKPWTLENDDTALLDLIPFLEYVALHKPADIRPVLASYQGRDIPSEFIERSKEYQRRVQEQKQHKRFW